MAGHACGLRLHGALSSISVVTLTGVKTAQRYSMRHSDLSTAGSFA